MPFKFILSIKKDKLHKGLRLQDREPSCSPSGFKKQGQAPPARARDVSRGRRLSKVDVGVGWAGLHPPEADQTGSLSLRRDHSKLVFPGKELTKKFFVCHKVVLLRVLLWDSLSVSGMRFTGLSNSQVCIFLHAEISSVISCLNIASSPFSQLSFPLIWNSS